MSVVDSDGSQMSPLTDKSFYQEPVNICTDKFIITYPAPVISYPIQLEKRMNIKQDIVSQ